MTPSERAAAHGVGILLADLGDWGGATLVAEYDPDGPQIRINVRALERLCPDVSARRALIDRAIMHELYHHFEATGAVVRRATRAEREREAHAHAGRGR